MDQPDRNSPCACGSTKKYKHCCLRKLKSPTQKHPSQVMVPTWMKLAMQHAQAGHVLQAKLLFEQVLFVNPSQADALHALGLIHFQSGNNSSALNLIRRAVDIWPGGALFLHNLGIVSAANGLLEDAVACYGKVLEIQPQNAQVYCDLGKVFKRQHRLSDAVVAYRRALQHQPHFADAFYNLGNAFQALGQNQEAIESFQQAVQINPNFFEAIVNLAVALYGQGDVRQSLEYYERAVALKPMTGLRINCALMVPAILGTLPEVQVSRERLGRNLAQLLDETLVLTDPIREFCATNFYLAFQGQNDRDLQEKIAHLYEKACPSLLYKAAHCDRPRRSDRKIQVGFLSKYIFRHSVSLSFGKIVSYLAAEPDFEVALISSHDPQHPAARNAYPSFQGRFVHLSEDLAQARDQVAAEELDVLVYLDIGMEPLSYFLAFARLARVQCVTGGHPVTTGISTVDYFLSSDQMEPEDAEFHYSEKLVRLPLGFFYFERPALPLAYKTRQELGLPTLGRVYLCPMTLQKLHPDFDAALALILELDPQAHIVLFADSAKTTWKPLLEQRFTHTIPWGVRSRIVFLPWITESIDFISVNAAADVVLDPFHFGIGSTAIVTCAVGTPFVTKPGEFMRGRAGLLYSKLLNVMECVADDVESYANKAVAIATTPASRKQIKDKILANNHVLFENQQTLGDAAAFLRTVAI